MNYEDFVVLGEIPVISKALIDFETRNFLEEIYGGNRNIEVHSWKDCVGQDKSMRNSIVF